MTNHFFDGRTIPPNPMAPPRVPVPVPAPDEGRTRRSQMWALPVPVLVNGRIAGGANPIVVRSPLPQPHDGGLTVDAVGHGHGTRNAAGAVDAHVLLPVPSDDRGALEPVETREPAVHRRIERVLLQIEDPVLQTHLVPVVRDPRTHGLQIRTHNP